MQVKRFEAPTMTGVLQIIKEKLGPDAVILSTKNVKGRGGLETCVQVMAAPSQERFDRKSTSRKESQGERGDGLESNQSKEFQSKEFQSKELTNTPYIQISEKEERSLTGGIQKAVQRAHVASTQFEDHKESRGSSSIHVESGVKVDSKRLESLQDEITRLKSVISDFQKVPQNFLSLHPGAESGIPYEMSSIFNKLIRAGVNEGVTVEIIKRAQEAMGPQRMKNHHLVEAWVVKYLLDSIVCEDNRFEGRYHLFVGPAGHGKTSSLVKLASQMVVSGHKSVGIVVVDHTKVGAVEPLRTYAKILNIDFAHVEEPKDWPFVNRDFSQLDYIFVDFPGSSFQHGEEVFDLMARFLPLKSERKIHYVQSVLSREAEMDCAIGLFSRLGIDDIIFTRLDESVQHGIILNVQRKHELPLHSFGIGSDIPEDIEPATRERIVDLIFKLTKVDGKEVNDEFEL